MCISTITCYTFFRARSVSTWSFNSYIEICNQQWFPRCDNTLQIQSHPIHYGTSSQIPCLCNGIQTWCNVWSILSPILVMHYVRILIIIKPIRYLFISTLSCNLATFYLQFQQHTTTQNLLFHFHKTEADASIVLAQDAMSQYNRILISWRNILPPSSSANRS
jgi:hypothetical protein